MARYEFVKTSLWQDAWFQELPPAEKAAFIFLFTNEAIRPSGIYPLTKKTWAFFSGFEISNIQSLSKKWEKEGKIKYDETKGIIWVVNYLLHNPNKHLPNVKTAIYKDMESFGNCCFFNEFLKAYQRLLEGSPSLTNREGKVREGVFIDGRANGRHLQEVVEHFKTLKGFEGDKEWDKVHFSRCSVSAKSLLEYLGTPEVVKSCMDDIKKKMEKDGLSWTLETIVKHSPDWKKKSPKPLTDAEKKYEEEKWKKLKDL